MESKTTTTTQITEADFMANASSFTSADWKVEKGSFTHWCASAGPFPYWLTYTDPKTGLTKTKKSRVLKTLITFYNKLPA